VYLHLPAEGVPAANVPGVKLKSAGLSGSDLAVVVEGAQADRELLANKGNSPIFNAVLHDRFTHTIFTHTIVLPS
jgi:hypothetical protein